MNKTTIAIVVVVILVVGAVVLWKMKPVAEEPVVETPTETLNRETQADSTADIDTSLSAIDTDSDIDAELSSIDAELTNI